MKHLKLFFKTLPFSLGILFISSLLYACNSPSSVQSSSPASSSAQIQENIEEWKQDFIENFSETYPDFILLDSILGDETTAPILFAAIAQNQKNGSSSTLFIVDQNDVVHTVILASSVFATYRPEDDLILKENVIHVSFDVTPDTPDATPEIHDFELTVTQNKENGVTNTTFSSKENIRSMTTPHDKP